MEKVAGPLPAAPAPANIRQRKICQKPLARPMPALAMPAATRPMPMINRRLIMSKRRDTGRLKKALKVAAASPTSRLICVSLSPRSFLIGSTSSVRRLWCPKTTNSVVVKMTTPYQDLPGLGQG